MKNKNLAAMSIVCALMVVYIHVPHVIAGSVINAIFHHFVISICRIAVPFFFLSSGYFLSRHITSDGWYACALKKRVKSLLVPYVLWNVLFLLFVFFTGLQDHNIPPFSDGFGVVSILGLNFISGPILHPTWYLRALLILVIVSPMIVYGLQHFGARLVVAFGAIYLLGMVFTTGNVYMHRMLRFGISLEGLTFFSFGLLCGINSTLKNRLVHEYLKHKLLYCFLSFFCIGLQLVCRNWKPIVWGLHPLAIVLLMPMIYHAVCRISWLSRFSCYSLPIYLTHLFAVAIVNEIPSLKHSIVLAYCFVLLLSFAISSVITTIPWPKSSEPQRSLIQLRF